MTKLCSCGCGKPIGKDSTWAKGHNPNKRRDVYDWSNVVEDYRRLGTLETVAEQYGCTLQAVHHQLKKRDIDTSNEMRDWSNLLADYERLKSVVKVAKEYGCSYRTVIDRISRIEGFRFSHDNKSLDSSSGIGRYGELIALYILKESIDMNEVTIHYPYDVEWKGLKIDVKTSKKRKRSNGKIQYTFSTKNQQCDFYLLIALDDNCFPVKFLFVPRDEVDGVTVSFTYGCESKWDKYKMEVDQNEVRRAVRNAKSIR